MFFCFVSVFKGFLKVYKVLSFFKVFKVFFEVFSGFSRVFFGGRWSFGGLGGFRPSPTLAQSYFGPGQSYFGQSHLCV